MLIYEHLLPVIDVVVVLVVVVVVVVVAKIIFCSKDNARMLDFLEFFYAVKLYYRL